MGITIKDAPLVEQLSGDEKIPISDGSNEPRTVNVEQIKEFANKDIEIPKKVSELENDSGYATSKEVEDAISKIPTPDVGGQISAALVDYVKKVEGKGLSTNDFTNELKAKLGTIIPNDISELEAEISKLGTTLNTLVGGNASNAIESFNEIIAFLKNVSDTESLSSIIAGINTRIAEVEAKIPTKVSELENDKNYLTEHQDISHLATKEELQGKQDVIQDLNAIREGASKGATALQSIPKEYVTKDELDRLLSDSPFEFVDLGLPSGTLWAKCNIGASNPEEAGLFFAWGETEGYKVTYTEAGNIVTSTTITDANGNITDKQFIWEYYKWGSDYNKLTKYNTNPNYGVVDNLSKLNLVDDPVYVLDRNSRMPSVADFEELIAHTTFSKVAIGNQGCGKFTAQNGNYIIFPAVGRVIEDISGPNLWAIYPAREINPSTPCDCKLMYFTSSHSPAIETGGRNVGLPVRAVKNKLYGNDDYYYTKEEVDVKDKEIIVAFDSKQDTIEDLAEIRQGASRAIPTKTSELTNDSGFLTEYQDISHLATKTEVNEVNAKATQALNKAIEAGENFNALETIVNTKAGAFYVENETGLFVIFKDEASKSAYLTSGDESGVLGKFALGGASSETVYMMTVNTPKDLYSFTTSSQKMEITAGFTSQVKYTDEEGYIEFKEAALFSVSVIKSGAEAVVVSSGNVVKQGETFTFDVKPYVGNGDNTVVITAEGLVSASKGVTAVTVGVTSMALLPMDFKWNTPFVEGQSYALGGMKVLGTLDKKLHIKMSGTEYSESYEVNIGTAQYDDVAYNFEGLVHPSATGVYKVELWLEATESGLTSETLTYRIMCIKADEVNTAQLICINDVATEVLNYSESKLFSYAVYNGGASTATPSITIHKDSDIIAESALSVSTSTVHDYVYSFMLNIAENTAQIGVFATFGNEAAAIITLKNEASLAPVAGYSFYMDAATRANGDDSREFFINEATQEKVNASWVDMAWVNGMDGWTTDDEGNKCLLIPAMSSASVDLTPMKNVSTVTIEMLYKVSNVSDFNEDIITLLKYTASSWIGMRIKPTNITLHSQSLFTEDLKQGYNTKDEEMVHLVVTIISNYSGIGNVAMIYVNGVKKCSFEWSKGDTFSHDGTLKLGSQTADLYLYKMRVYGFAFAWQQVMQNYIASITSSEQKALVRRKEDSVLNDANEIDYDKVYGVYNTFVVELPKGAQIPNRKNNPSNDAINGTNLYINIIQDPTCTIQGDWLNVPLEGQGTTAMTYYRWNLRSKTSSAYDKFRITAKKNVASSMHSHKRGATALYNDLNLAIVGANEANGRVAVYQYPVYGFQKIENEDKPGTYYYQFIGLYTIGPDKGDKSTFGYDDERFENTLIHMEGTDHSPRGVGMEYPWEQMVVGLNEDGDAFIGSKGADGTMNEGAWEIGACGDKESVEDMKAYLDVEFAPAYKLDYECTPMIVGLPSGTSIDDVNADIKNFRSQVADNGFSYADCHIYIDGEFDLYYFNIVSQTYVKDGRKIYQGLADYGFSTSELASKDSVLDKTKYIRQYRMARHKAEVGNYWLLDDSLFHACFLDLIGATDNEKKNSYPYKFGTLASGSRWRWRQDDLDTIFDVNNQGSADKKYSIMNTDTLNGDMIYKGNTSYHWRCIREYYKDEYKAMMKRIMAKMVELCPNGYGTSQIQKLIGCLRRYFWDYAQDYFTGGAYNQDAKWTYEDTWAIYQNDKSVNAVHPLQQSLGSHYEAEVSWVTLRMLFLASMNEFGAFVDYVDSSEGQVSFRQGGDFTFSLTPAIDMRPAVIQGKNSKKIHADGRILAGESVNISMPTDTSADTMVYIQGADWLSDIGDFSKVQIGSTDKTFSVSSKRAQRIKVGDENESEVTTNIGKLDVGYCPSVVEVEARNVSALSDNVDLSKCPRLRRAYFGGTNVTAITLPDGSKIQEYDLPSSLIRLSLRKLPLLTNEGLTYESLNDLSYLWVEDNTSIEGYDLLRTALAGGSPLNNIRVIGFNKVGDSNDFNFIMQLTNGEYHGIDAEGNADNTGYPIIEGHLHIAGSTTQENIDFLKGKFPALVLTADQIVNYFKFADPEVSRIVAENWGDGTGTTIEQIEAITDIGTKFRGNTLIETFDELEKFKKVNNIVSYAFKGDSNLKSVKSDNVTSLGEGVFRNCPELIEVSFPNLTEVSQGGQGFASESTKLEKINVSKLAYPMNRMFYMLSSLKELKWDNINCTKLPTAIFQQCGLEADIYLPNLEIIEGNRNFYYSKINNVINLGKITKVPSSCFSGTSKLNEVHFPTTVTDLSASDIFSSSAVQKITGLDNVTKIGSNFIRECTRIKTLELGSKLESIGEYMLASFGQTPPPLETLIIKATIPPQILNTTFWGNSLGVCKIYVPDASVEAYKAATNWNAHASRIQSIFYYLGYIDFVDPAVRDICVANFDTDGDGVVSMEEAAAVTDIGTSFKSNKEITNFDEFKYFTGITTCSNGAFQGCSNLESIKLPSSLTAIPDNFLGGTAIHEIVIPGNVKTLAGYFELSSCPNLKRVIIEEGVTNCARRVCTASPVEYLQIPSTLKVPSYSHEFFALPTLKEICFTGDNVLDWVFPSCIALTTYSVGGNSTLKSIDGVLFSSDEKTLVRVPSGITSYNIPNGTEIIGEKAFYYNITNVITIPETVTEIQNAAFNYSSFKEIYIPDSVVKLSDASNIYGDKFVFASSKYLQTVRMSANIKWLINRMFANCSSLKKVTNIDNVTWIQSGVFKNCTSLESFIIPASVGEIGGGYKESLFANCNSLKAVICLRDTPPVLKYESALYTFDSLVCPIYVPSASLTSYQEANYWSEWADNIKPINVADTLPDIGSVAENDLYKIGDVYWKAELVDNVLTWVEI